MQSSTAQQIPGISDAKTRLGDREFDLSYHRRHSEELIRYLLLACGAVSIFTTIGIVLVLAGNTIGFFQSRAFVIAKAPVAEAAPKATLTGGISASDRLLPVEYLADATQFA